MCGCLGFSGVQQVSDLLWECAADSAGLRSSIQAPSCRPVSCKTGGHAWDSAQVSSYFTGEILFYRWVLICIIKWLYTYIYRQIDFFLTTVHALWILWLILDFYRASICEGSLGSRNSVCLSHAWIVTKLNDALQIFLYHTKGQSLCYSDTNSGWWAMLPSLWNLRSKWPTSFEKHRLRPISAHNVSTVGDSEKSSITTNIKSTTGFPTSHRWSAYVTPKCPKGWLKEQFFVFWVKVNGWSSQALSTSFAGQCHKQRMVGHNVAHSHRQRSVFSN